MDQEHDFVMTHSDFLVDVAGGMPAD